MCPHLPRYLQDPARAGFFFEANVPPLWIGVRVHMDLRSKSA